jgi:hypothetical protein
MDLNGFRNQSIQKLTKIVADFPLVLIFEGNLKRGSDKTSRDLGPDRA